MQASAPNSTPYPAPGFAAAGPGQLGGHGIALEPWPPLDRPARVVERRMPIPVDPVRMPDFFGVCSEMVRPFRNAFRVGQLSGGGTRLQLPVRNCRSDLDRWLRIRLLCPGTAVAGVSDGTLNTTTSQNAAALQE